LAIAGAVPTIPRPLHAARGGRAEEAREDARQVLGGDADAMVAHGDHSPLLLGLHVHVNRNAVRAVLHGVADQTNYGGRGA
jgi:hypothetical protein